TILNHVCQKATTKAINMRTQTTMKDGNMVKSEVADTTTITAWYATDIPVQAAPEVYGQLPGLVLQLEKNSPYAISTYTATEVSDKLNLAAIKAPAKGKKVTADEMKKEMEKLMKQMMENNGPIKQGTPMRFGN
uniref:GLPGLI family protein n=1 Tax=Pedobacter borealis TaxID=475254 RepID=UPI0004930076